MIDKSNKTHNISHMPISTIAFFRDDSIRCPNCGQESMLCLSHTPAGEQFDMDNWSGFNKLHCKRCKCDLWDYTVGQPMYLVRNGTVINGNVKVYL